MGGVVYGLNASGERVPLLVDDSGNLQIEATIAGYVVVDEVGIQAGSEVALTTANVSALAAAIVAELSLNPAGDLNVNMNTTEPGWDAGNNIVRVSGARSYTRVPAAGAGANTVIKAAPGIFCGFYVNTAGDASNTVSIYNCAAVGDIGAGTLVETIAAPAVGWHMQDVDIDMTAGIIIVTARSAGNTAAFGVLWL